MIKLEKNRIYKIKTLEEIKAWLEHVPDGYDSKEYIEFSQGIASEALKCMLVHREGTAMDVQGLFHNIHIDLIEREIIKEQEPEYFL